MIFVGYDQLYQDTLELIKRLPKPIHAVYGVPRSGMLPAAIVASILHIPLGVVGEDGLVDFPFGGRCRQPEAGPLNFLIIDDSLSSGTAMNTAKQRVKRSNCVYAAVYVQPGSENFVDVYGKLLPGDRVFAWNILNSASLSKCCVDFDGVLCLDPVVTEEEAYKQWIITATPLSRPQFPIGAIVSGRSVEYLALTSGWLKRQGIRTGQLKLAPEKRGKIDPIVHKATFYKDSQYELFIESHASQAEEIARLSGKPVLAVDNMRIYEGGRSSS